MNLAGYWVSYFSKAFIHLAGKEYILEQAFMNIGVFVAEGGVDRIRTDDPV